MDEKPKDVVTTDGSSPKSIDIIANDQQIKGSTSDKNRTEESKIPNSNPPAVHLIESAVFKRGETKSPTLLSKPNESQEKAIERLSKMGWDLEKVPHHWGPGTNQLHAGQLDGCAKCARNVHRATSLSKVLNDPKRFEHHVIGTHEELIKLWNNVPPGKMPVAYLHCRTENQNGLHMTMFYVPCNVSLASALFLVAQKFKEFYPSVEVKVKGDSTINSALYPGVHIYSLSVKIDRVTTSILDRIGLRKWLAHMTDHTGKLTIGTTLKLVPEFEIIYSKLNDEVYDVDAVKSYTDFLHISEAELLTLNGVKNNDERKTKTQERGESVGECKKPDARDIQRRVDESISGPVEQTGRQ